MRTVTVRRTVATAHCSGPGRSQAADASITGTVRDDFQPEALFAAARATASDSEDDCRRCRQVIPSPSQLGPLARPGPEAAEAQAVTESRLVTARRRVRRRPGRLKFRSATQTLRWSLPARTQCQWVLNFRRHPGLGQRV